MATTMQVSVVSPGSSVWSGEATFVTAKTVEGEIGILPRHQPLLGELVPGTIGIDPVGGERVHMRVDGGFLSVSSTGVSVLAEVAEIL